MNQHICHYRTLKLTSIPTPALSSCTSKTDLFTQGINIYLGATDSHICPVSGPQGIQPGPLFITDDNKCLTQALFSQKLDTILDLLHINITPTVSG